MKKDRYIRARATEAEERIVRYVAKHECLNVSEFIRELVRNHARQLGIWPPDLIEDEDEGESEGNMSGRGPP